MFGYIGAVSFGTARRAATLLPGDFLSLLAAHGRYILRDKGCQRERDSHYVASSCRGKLVAAIRCVTIASRGGRAPAREEAQDQ